MAASPAELRSMFGANLRALAADYTSISELSRRLGINRTQFNRYLAGESFPRPDVLARMCSFFDVDARVLLEPVAEIGKGQDPINNPFLRDYVGVGAQDVSENMFPSGFYRFSRASFVSADVFVLGLVHIRRQGANTFLRGFETKEAMRSQDLPTQAEAREFRGIVLQQEDGLALIVSRRNAMTCSFNYLSRVASFENNFWQGYITRTIPDATGDKRVTRLAYEHLGTDLKDVLPIARSNGFCKAGELPAFHRRLLRPDDEFL
jgi:transcriptional regulator with XRE-family HTH domain